MSSDNIHVVLEQSRDWVALIITAMVPVVVMLITLYVSKRRQKEALAQQAAEHIAAMDKQEEINRINCLPYFVTTAFEVKPRPKDSLFIISIDLKNIGNGTAASLSFECIEELASDYYLPVHETDNFVYTVSKAFTYESSVAQVNSTVNAQFSVYSKSPDNAPRQLITEPFTITIKYMDMMGRPYRQVITLKYMADLTSNKYEVTDLYSFAPNLITEVTTNEAAI